MSYRLRDAQRSTMISFLDSMLNRENLTVITLSRVTGSRPSKRGEFTIEELATYETTDQVVNAIIAHDSVQGGGKHRLLAYGTAPEDSGKAAVEIGKHTFEPQREVAGSATGSKGTDAAAETMSSTLASVASMMGDQAATAIGQVVEGQRESMALMLETYGERRASEDDLKGEIMALHRENMELRLKVSMLEFKAEMRAEAPMTAEDRIQMMDGVASILTGVTERAVNMFIGFKQLQQIDPPAVAPAPGG